MHQRYYNWYQVFVEFTDAGVVVFYPGSLKVVTTVPSLKDALTLARMEWPNLGIRLITSSDVLDCLAPVPPRCASVA